MTINAALARSAGRQFASIENSIWYQARSLQPPYSAISRQFRPLLQTPRIEKRHF